MTERVRSIPRQPAEGWISLLLVFVLAGCLAWSIAQSRWVIGNGALTSFLPWAAAGGVAWGFISAKVGWSRWLAHLLGAVFAGLILPIMVGGVLKGDFTPGPAFSATANSTLGAYFDLTYLGKSFTQEYGHFMLILAILCWGNGQFTSYAVFGHHRPLNAVIMSGIALILNMSLTLDEQLVILIWFSLAALFLLIRLHALDERSAWLRHRLGDAESLSSFYLRGGTAFIAVAVFGSLILTSTAASAPLASVWRGVDQRLVEMTQGLNAILRGGGAGTRISPVDFLSSTRITTQWVTDPTPVLSIKVSDNGEYHWRARTYDHFDGSGWSETDPHEAAVAAGAPLGTGALDAPGGLLDRRPVTVEVTELNFDPPTIIAADAPTKVSVPSTMGYLGTSPDRFGAYVTKSGASEYQVTSEVPDFAPSSDASPDPNALTANKLRVAGTAYPVAVQAYYLPLDSSITNGPYIQALLTRIKAVHPDIPTPYDVSKAIEGYLKDEGGFRYQTDLSGVNCGNQNAVECFARTKVGTCQYYASTMVVLLRMDGIPARYVQGFLPSKPDASGVELIRKSAAHAWVEVYFPSYGWITFDPTSGGLGQEENIAEGAKVTPLPTVSARPAGSGGVRATDLRRTPGRNETGPSSIGVTGTGPGGGGFILIGLLLAAIMGVLVFVAWQRGPRKAQEPDRVYGGVVGLARRFGFGPRANQTVYEFAGSLGDILPGARPDLHTVAVAKVEVAYGRRTLDPARIDALRLAQRHLRIALFGLIFRRSERKAQGRKRPPA